MNWQSLCTVALISQLLGLSLLARPAIAAPLVPERPQIVHPKPPRAPAVAPAAEPRPAVTTGENALRGWLVARHHSVLSAGRSGRVDELSVNVDQHVAQGDVLLRLDCGLLREQRKVASAEADMAGKRVAAAFAAEGALVSLLQAEHARALAALQVQEASLRECDLVAPFAGRVAAVSVTRHQYVQTGQVLVHLVNDAELLLEFDAPPAWSGWLRPGFRMQFFVEQTGRSYRAQVQRALIDPAQRERQLRVSAAISGPYAELRAGMSARLPFVMPASSPATDVSPARLLQDLPSPF